MKGKREEKRMMRVKKTERGEQGIDGEGKFDMPRKGRKHRKEK